MGAGERAANPRGQLEDGDDAVGAGGCQEQQREVLELAAHLAAVAAELIDVAFTPPGEVEATAGAALVVVGAGDDVDDDAVEVLGAVAF